MTARPVAFLVKGFPRLSETFVLHEFLELRRQGVELRLLAVLDPEEQGCHEQARPLLEEVTHLRSVGRRGQLAAISHALSNHPVGLVRGLRWLLAQHRRTAVRRLLDALVLVRICDQQGIRHIHSHFASVPTSTAYVARRVGGLTYSFTGHAKDVYTLDPIALRLRVAEASAVVTCTDANRRYFEETIGIGPGIVRVLRHGIPLAEFLAVPRTPVPGTLLTVGRLVPKKGHDTIMQAVADLVSRGVDVRWRVVGSGPERGALAALADDLGIADRVSFCGRRTADEVRAELAGADAFVLGSRVLADGDRDGIPNVILEAMAAGVPIVATAVSGIPEVVEDGVTGLLVPPDDPSALAAAIETTLGDEIASGRRADAARTWATEHCDLNRSVAPLAALLRSLGGATP